MMRLVDYIKYKLDKAIDMCRDSISSKDDIALYIRDFEKDLYGRERTVVDEYIKEESQYKTIECKEK